MLDFERVHVIRTFLRILVPFWKRLQWCCIFYIIGDDDNLFAKLWTHFSKNFACYSFGGMFAPAMVRRKNKCVNFNSTYIAGKALLFLTNGSFGPLYQMETLQKRGAGTNSSYGLLL